MSTYHDRYARFGVIIGILVGVAILAIIGWVSSCRSNLPLVVHPVRVDRLVEAGYLDSSVLYGDQNLRDLQVK